MIVSLGGCSPTPGSVVGGQPLGGGAGVSGQASRLSATPSPSLSGIGVSDGSGIAVSIGIGVGSTVGGGASVGGDVSVGAIVEVGKTKSVAVGGGKVAVMKRVAGANVKNCPGVFASVPSGVILGSWMRVAVASVRVGSAAGVVAVIGRVRGGADPQSRIPAQ
jgi:hypothetical protein